jgi:kynurenine formamidase
MAILDLWKNMECIDLSVTLSEAYPVSWPTVPQYRKRTLNWFEDFHGPDGELVRSQGAYYDQYLEMDEHAGTHVDFPIHFLPPAELERVELKFGREVPLQNFAGAAVVIDARPYLDQAEGGKSPRIPVDVLWEWEEKHGEMRAGEIPLLNTGFMDRYFAPFPEGKRLVEDVISSKALPGWPVPSDQFFELLGDRGIRHLGISSPSMGALDDPIGPHLAGLRLGMTFAECLIGLDRVPPRGGLYVGLPLKIDNQSGSPIRAVAFVPKTN